MSKIAKTLARVLGGDADANIRFNDLRNLLSDFGFDERIRGDHHIFSREGIDEILNLQPRAGKAKAYQVKQVRNVFISYNLAGEAEPEPTDSFIPSDPESDDGK